VAGGGVGAEVAGAAEEGVAEVAEAEEAEVAAVVAAAGNSCNRPRCHPHPRSRSQQVPEGPAAR